MRGLVEGGEGLLVALASPSGAGKTTLKNRLLAEFDDLRFSVSHTTRSPRSHEVDGREYHFVDRAVFAQMAERGAFGEWAEVFGNFYGTSLGEIEAARAEGKGLLFDVDHQGARQLSARLPGLVKVFVVPPSFVELERRLRARGDEGEVSMRRRLAEARSEIEHYAFFDYVIVNDELERAYAELRAVVVAERARRWRRAQVVERLLREGRVGEGR